MDKQEIKGESKSELESSIVKDTHRRNIAKLQFGLNIVNLEIADGVSDERDALLNVKNQNEKLNDKIEKLRMAN